MQYTTNYDRQIKAQSKTFEGRLCKAIESGEIEGGKILTTLMIEAKEIYRVGFFTPKEYKDLTNIELYKEICR